MLHVNEINEHEIEPSSPHKRRKTSRIPLGLSKLDQLLKIRRDQERKRHDIDRARLDLRTLKNHKSDVETEGYNLEQESLKLKGQLDLLRSQMEELKQFEAQSLADLDAKLELTRRKLNLEHQQMLAREKEEVSGQIEEIIGSIQQEHIDQRNSLVKNCDLLAGEIRDFNDHTSKLILEVRSNVFNEFEVEKAQNSEKMNLIALELKDLEAKIDDEKRRGNSLDSKFTEVSRKSEVLQKEYDALKLNYEAKENEVNDISAKMKALESDITSMEANITENTNEINRKLEKFITMKNALVAMENERRYLHNKLQELKGNIRVYCRIRPPSPAADQELSNIEYPHDDNDVDEDLNQLVVFSRKNDKDYGSQDRNSYKFSFDKVFHPGHKNHQIFEELSQLVQSSLDGYNVCVFAYGQTGSGKTWTMSHPRDGMIPLTINKIFSDIETLKQAGWEYQVTGQFMEIYNETIIDLLDNSSSEKYEIKHDDVNGKTTISNLKLLQLNSEPEALSMFTKYSQNRSTASTNLNQRSSRSHSIFILSIKGSNSKTGNTCEGQLNLVDLAGSERLNNSQVKGDRLKETQNINKSLSCLGDVIYALGRNNNHIPYRNSKLTYLLKHSLGGNSKTLMFVNISPLLVNFNESLNSFRFATNVGKTKQKK